MFPHPHVLGCTVCKGEFLSKTSWLQHLTSDEHQRLARKESLQKWGVNGIKERCLVIFSSFPLTVTLTLEEDDDDSGVVGGGADAVIQHFSKAPYVFVTDFVWWEDRDCIGLIQFESRKMVKHLLSTLKDSKELVINNERAQVKWAADLADLEWNAILPRGSYLPQPSTENESIVPESTYETAMKVEVTSNPPISAVHSQATSAQLQSTDLIEDDIQQQETYNENTAHENKSRKRALEASNQQEEKESCKKKWKTNEETEDDTSTVKNAITLLKELIQERQWPPPKFRYTFHKVEKSPKTFSCCVLVNRIEYQPDTAPTSTKRQAKLDAASFCLKLLTDRKSKIVTSAAMQAPSFPHETVPISVSNSSPESLHYQYWCLSRSIKIPDHDYNSALKVIYGIKKLFSGNDPTAEAVMFRNYYLKLQNPCPKNTELLIYVYNAREPPQHPQSVTWIRDTEVWQVLSSPEGIQQFTILESLEDSSRFNDLVQEVGWKVKHIPSETIFRMIFYKRFISEVQISRMVEYMCTFDPCCHPLLTLTYYWASTNSVSVGGYSNKKHCHHSLPDPTTLQWLVVFFLCHKGIIPTPREIQQRPHVVLKERLTKVDVGFQPDPEFAREWISKRRQTESSSTPDETTEEFTLFVVTLFQEFLQFFGQILDGGNWILNTRDGELISMEKFLSCEDDDDASWTTKMTKEEITECRGLHHQKTRASSANNPVGVGRKYKINFTEWKLYMIHPFVVTWKFSVAKNIVHVLKLMRYTGLNLKRFLNLRRKYDDDGVDAVVKKGLGTLEDALKIEKTARSKMNCFFNNRKKT